MRRSLRVANFLQLNAHRPFCWGEWDCNLFIVDLLDHVDGDLPRRSRAIRGKYHNRLGAARFQYNYTPAPEWLEQQGYNIITSAEFREHDIILEPKRRFWSANYYFAGRTWAVIEDRALMINVVEPGQHMIARLNNG